MALYDLEIQARDISADRQTTNLRHFWDQPSKLDCAVNGLLIRAFHSKHQRFFMKPTAARTEHNSIKKHKIALRHT